MPRNGFARRRRPPCRRAARRRRAPPSLPRPPPWRRSRSRSDTSGTRVSVDPGRGQRRVLDEQPTTGGHDVGSVEPLLAVADRQGHVDRGEPDRGQLAHGVGTGAGDHEVGRGIREVHPVGVGCDDVGGAGTAGVGLELLARAGQVQDLHARRAACVARAASKAVLRRCAPSEPPVTRTVGQCGSRPKCASRLAARGDPVELGDLAAQRHADGGGVGAAWCSRTWSRRTASSAPRGGWRARPGVLLVHDDRDVRDAGRRGRRGWRRSRRSRRPPGHRSARWPARRRRRRRAGCRAGAAGLPDGPAGQGHLRDGHQRVAALGDQPRLEAGLGAERGDGDVGVAAAQAVGQGEQRRDVTGRPATGQQDRRGPGVSSASATSRDVPAGPRASGARTGRASPRAPRAAGFLAGEGQQHAEGEHRGHERGPAVRHQRQRDADDGEQPDDRADVDDRLARRSRPSRRPSRPGRTCRRSAARSGSRPAPAAQNRPSSTRVPGSPSSSPMIAKMKSLCASGSQLPLLPAGPEADAPPAAVGQGVAAVERTGGRRRTRWCRLPSHTSNRCSRFGLVTTNHVTARAPNERAAVDEHPARHPGREQQGRDDPAEHHDGAEVVAEQHQPDRHGRRPGRGTGRRRACSRPSSLRLRGRTAAPTRTSPTLTNSDGCSVHRAARRASCGCR